ncbi:MAG TPA: hypothetical protein VND19_24415 [Acetobacteraceae bacterium]|nr:hypothetical protein [Acetobacteraceae bacterium]
MATQTLEFPPSTEEAIDRLKKAFRVNSTAEVISRALALADEAQRYAGDGTVIVLSGPGGNTKIDLAR